MVSITTVFSKSAGGSFVKTPPQFFLGRPGETAKEHKTSVT
jgi:hypothetical protein